MGELIGGAPRLPQSEAPLLARYAGSILWLARYIERIENIARLLDVTKSFANDAERTENWRAILRINADEERFFAVHMTADMGSVVHFYLLDRGNPTSIQSAMHAARENARTLRALISTEMWLQINVLYARIRGLAPPDAAPEELSRVCALLKEGAQALTGITEGTFYRDQSWSFYAIGRHLERADQTTRLIDIRLSALLPLGSQGGEVEAWQWQALLRAAAGHRAFRRVHPSGYAPADVVGFLLLDPAFPRSVALNLAQVGEQLRALRLRYGLAPVEPALRRLARLHDRHSARSHLHTLWRLDYRP